MKMYVKLFFVFGITFAGYTEADNCHKAEITYDPSTSVMKAEWSGINFNIKPDDAEDAASTGGLLVGDLFMQDVKDEISKAIQEASVGTTQSDDNADLKARVAKLEETVRSIVSMPERRPKIKPNASVTGVPPGEIDIMDWVPASNGYEYFIGPKYSYESAKRFCETRDAKLAIVGLRDSKVRQYLLEKLVKKRGESVWIALNDTENEADWYWEDGVKSTLFNTQWAGTEPDGTGDCAFMYYKTGDVYDYKCRSYRRAFCER